MNLNKTLETMNRIAKKRYNKFAGVRLESPQFDKVEPELWTVTVYHQKTARDLIVARAHKESAEIAVISACCEWIDSIRTSGIACHNADELLDVL